MGGDTVIASGRVYTVKPDTGSEGQLSFREELTGGLYFGR